jgi:hypothetical protein
VWRPHGWIIQITSPAELKNKQIVRLQLTIHQFSFDGVFQIMTRLTKYQRLALPQDVSLVTYGRELSTPEKSAKTGILPSDVNPSGQYAKLPTKLSKKSIVCFVLMLGFPQCVGIIKEIIGTG